MPKMVTPAICLTLNDAFGAGVGVSAGPGVGVSVGPGVGDGSVVGINVIVGVAVSEGVGEGIGVAVLDAVRFNTRLRPVSQVPISIA